MLARMAAIALIYFCIAAAWTFLANTVTIRTAAQDESLKNAVGQLWGTQQRQFAPLIQYQTTRQIKAEAIEGDKTVEPKFENVNQPLLLDGGDIKVDLGLDYRQKGLLWYSTYRVQFDGKYRVTNYTDNEGDIFFNFSAPAQSGVYDNFRLVVGGKEIQNLPFNAGVLSHKIRLAPGQSETFEVGYGSQGMDEWWYDFGKEVNQIKNFSLEMHTDFHQIDFPQSSLSPTQKTQEASGWNLKWQYGNLLSGVKIGMIMPRKLNPGPWVSQITFAAPVSLFLFFFVIFVLTTVKNIKLHPMNYFFIGAAFFSFHLLLAYLVDHVSIHVSFLICSLVSIALVVSYLRLAVGNRFAFIEAGVLQFVYLVLFSYTFFFERFTGLAITVLCILTLFVIMQFTGRIDWGALFRKGAPASTKA
ncbi:MAG: inner membrane CreD family protein [Chloracidobacterium sp.]|nr:inner membrane CreD family protein [Chloracidobacterium sp.]